MSMTYFLRETAERIRLWRAECDRLEAENAGLKANVDHYKSQWEHHERQIAALKARSEQRQPVLDAIRAALDSLAKALAMLEEK